MAGYLYFLTNPSMVGMVKIGYSSNSVESRINQLETTGVPTPFILNAQFLVRDEQAVEALVHKKLEKYRVNKQREFFTGNIQTILEQVIDIILNNVESKSSELKDKNNVFPELSEMELNFLVVLTN